MVNTLDMNIEKNANAIVVRFPTLSRGSGSPFIRDTSGGVFNFLMSEEPPLSRHQRTSQNPTLYFAHRAEESAFEPHPEERELNSYRGYHPTTVAHLAFSGHHGLVLSPEMMGAQLLLDFGEYVRDHPGPCGPIFDGKIDEKQRVKVWLPEGATLKDQETLFQAIGAWEKELHRHTDARIRDKLHPTFSGKNPVVDAVYGALLMGAAKEYFDFQFGSLCGIPEIRVTGTRNDWEQLSDLVSGLESVPELRQIAPYYAWANGEVLSGILGLYEGQEDPLFWSSVFHDKSQSGKDNQYTGWLPSFNLYTSPEGGTRRILETLARGEHPQRWRKSLEPQPICSPSLVPVVNITLISDDSENPPGIQNVDPHLSVNAGFTSVAYTDGFLKPVLGMDAYAKKDLKVHPNDHYVKAHHVDIRGEPRLLEE